MGVIMMANFKEIKFMDLVINYIYNRYLQLEMWKNI